MHKKKKFLYLILLEVVGSAVFYYAFFWVFLALVNTLDDCGMIETLPQVFIPFTAAAPFAFLFVIYKLNKRFTRLPDKAVYIIHSICTLLLWMYCLVLFQCLKPEENVDPMSGIPWSQKMKFCEELDDQVIAPVCMQHFYIRSKGAMLASEFDDLTDTDYWATYAAKEYDLLFRYPYFFNLHKVSEDTEYYKYTKYSISSPEDLFRLGTFDNYELAEYRSVITINVYDNPQRFSTREFIKESGFFIDLKAYPHPEETPSVEEWEVILGEKYADLHTRKDIIIGGEEGLKIDRGIYECGGVRAFVARGDRFYSFTSLCRNQTGSYVTDTMMEVFDVFLEEIEFL